MNISKAVAALEISGLHKYYGSFHALKGIDLIVNRGSFFGLLGANGAGKSTSIHMICGLTKKTQGSIKVLGYEVEHHHEIISRLIGLSQQEFNLDRFFPLHKLLRYHGRLYGIGKKILDHRLDELMSQFGLWEYRNQLTHRLSGGFKRRIMLVRALLHDPEILILDEPSAGVDIELRIDLWRYLKKLNQEGKTIILTTHYLEEAQSLCDDIALLREGEIILQGRKDDIVSKLKGNLINFFLPNPLETPHVE
ncbi:MAG: ABC transporter ATP-binding protein [Deltaproteobacteria bacterium]|nr:ABC transporter ATP-binding protein [Deltaproteobacteria bacterium]